MQHQDHHLTDRELLMALDHELPPRRQASVAAHLAQCPMCCDRRAQIDRAAATFVALYQDRAGVTRGEGHDSARARLRSTLNQIVQERQGSRREWTVSGLMSAPRWTTLGAAVAAAILLIRAVVQPSQPFDPRRTGPSVERDALPVASLTPGATWNVSLDELCAGGGREQRQIPAGVRHRVLGDYGMEGVPYEEYELDYLITPELGGAPDPRNLWPQRYTSRVWNAHVKDQLERLLPRLVCDGRVALETAQRDIALDWIAAYKKYFKTDTPLQTQAGFYLDDDRDSRDLDELTYPVWRAEGARPLQLVSFPVRP